MKNELSRLFLNGIAEIEQINTGLLQTLEREYERQKSVLMMVASCSLVPPSVLACMGMPTVNITAEGYPHQRYHAGCVEMDNLENYTICNARAAFNAEYANVQPHSATTANEIVTYSLVKPGDVIMGMELHSGGHLSHGASVSYSGSNFKVVQYTLDENYMIDYEQVESLAVKYKPKLIICGTTSYCRMINFKRFRDIADKVGAYLLADISHISGLVIAGLHQSPINHAHVTTTCTHKQIFGPRGGLILSGKDSSMKLFGKDITLKEHLQKAVFPFFQGAPMMNLISAKGVALDLTLKEEYKETMHRVVNNAKELANCLEKKGFDIVSGGTDNHIVLIDLSEKGITGDVAERALEQCGIIVNKNSVPNTKNINAIKRPSGIRIGTNSMAQRKIPPQKMSFCAQLIADVIDNIQGDKLDNFVIKEDVRISVLEKIRKLCVEYPIPGYEM